MILDGRFHGKMDGLEAQTLPSGALEGKITVRSVIRPALIEFKQVKQLVTVINYQSSPKLKLKKKFSDKILIQGEYNLSEYI